MCVVALLPNELTIETIKQSHRSYPQNPIIANALYKTGFLESWGSGVSRMMDACKAAGLPEPVYGTDGLFVWITFKRPSLDTNLDTDSVTNSVTDSVTDSDINSDINSDTSHLSDRQKAVLDYCIIPRSSREILEHIQVTYQYKNIAKFINYLVELGYLEKTIPNSVNSPKQKYVLKRKP